MRCFLMLWKASSTSFLPLWGCIRCILPKPRDNDHPYGHGKVEFVTSAIEGVLIVIAGVLIIIESVDSLITGVVLNQLDWGIVIIGLTL